MRTYHEPDSRTTQCARILRLLISARGGWVALPEILALGIAQYNARLYGLRRMGFHIENRTERQGGRRCSWFRLVLGPTPQPHLSITDCVATTGTFPEFGELAPESRYPD